MPEPHPTPTDADAKRHLLTHRPLARFVLLAVLGVLVLTLLWRPVSGWLALPAAQLCAWLLDSAASGWVEHTELSHQVLSVYSSLRISSEQTGWRLSEVIVDVHPARYGYSLPILWALLLAAGGPGRMGRMLAGALLLVPFHAFSILTQVLIQLCFSVQMDLQMLHIHAWQLELIVYAYQLGSLMLPPLVPLLLWLWLDQAFVRRTFVPSVRANG